MTSHKQEYPLITIATLTKNIVSVGRSHYLKKCIRSVQKQVYSGKIEHIFIDSNSVDGTIELINEERKDFVNYEIYSQNDTGIYDAMNIALHRARGRYIVFLNSDDYFSSNLAVQHSVDKLLEEDFDFSFSNYRTVSDHGLGNIRTHELGLFFLRMPFCHQTMFTKVDNALKIGGFNSVDFKSAGDWDFVLRFILSGNRGVYVNEDLVHFRLGGMSSNAELSNNECVKLMVKNYSKILPELTQNEISSYFYELKLPTQLYLLIEKMVDISVLYAMNKTYGQFIEDDKSYLHYIGIAQSRYFNDIPPRNLLENEVSHNNKLISTLIWDKIFLKIRYKLSFGKMRIKMKERYKVIQGNTRCYRVRRVFLLGVPVFDVYKNGSSECVTLFGVPIMITH